MSSIISVRPRVYAEADYSRAIDAHIESVAKAHGYESGERLASWALSTNPAWRAEGEAFVTWRDAVWLYAYQQMAAVQAQARTQPTPVELVAEMPTIVWPS